MSLAFQTISQCTVSSSFVNSDRPRFAFGGFDEVALEIPTKPSGNIRGSPWQKMPGSSSKGISTLPRPFSESGAEAKSPSLTEEEEEEEPVERLGADPSGGVNQSLSL